MAVTIVFFSVLTIPSLLEFIIDKYFSYLVNIGDIFVSIEKSNPFNYYIYAEIIDKKINDKKEVYIKYRYYKINDKGIKIYVSDEKSDLFKNFIINHSLKIN